MRSQLIEHLGGAGAATRQAAVKRLTAMIAEEERAATRVMAEPVRGPRSQHMTAADAVVRAEEMTNRIDLDEDRKSLRHRVVKPTTKIVALTLLGVVDFPMMLWLSSSVFNVDWANPWGLPLAISVVVALLGTAGSASALHHLGHNRRENKNDRRQMDWAQLSPSAKASLVAVVLLVGLIAVVMFLRVYTEGMLSGLDELAMLMAALIAFVMLLSAAMVFATAFRDGSPEQDDLAYYSALVRDASRRLRAHEDRAARLRQERALLTAQDPTRGLAELLGSVMRPVDATATRPSGATDRVRLNDSGAGGCRRALGIRRPV